MNKLLSNKKVLFFSPFFFSYENKIAEKMVELGAEVDMYDERSVKSSFDRMLLKVSPSIFNKKTEQYYFDILEKNKDKSYDYVFFIKCDMPTEKVLTKYREVFKNSKFILYLFDSISNIPNVEKKFKYFDFVSSFDRHDCLNNKSLLFRPLFYCDDYKSEDTHNVDYAYDLCFIGTIHSDRYKILKEIKKKADSLGLTMYCYPYLQSKFIYYVYKLLKKEFRDTKITDFEFDKISSKTIAEIVDKSKVIIDIQHPKQTGLTMRTIEMVGMKKKMITTNTDIVNYDFYNKKNITVIDRKDYNVDFNDISNMYEELDEVIYNRYSLDSWVMELLNYEKSI